MICEHNALGVSSRKHDCDAESLGRFFLRTNLENFLWTIGEDVEDKNDVGRRRCPQRLGTMFLLGETGDARRIRAKNSNSCQWQLLRVSP